MLCARFATALLCALLGLWSRMVHADLLQVEVLEGESNYVAVEELSYEAIVEPRRGPTARLRLRIALHNASLSTRDVVHTLVVPSGARLEGLALGSEGAWHEGRATRVWADPDRRDPESVFARLRPADGPGQLPAVQVVAFAIAPRTTLQVEVRLEVYPRRVGDRWQIDLPSRGVPTLGMQSQRRVLVRTASDDEGFFVDGDSNGGAPYVVTRSADAVTVAYSANDRGRERLGAHLEVMPHAAGFRGGIFELFLRLGPATTVRPDHVLLLVDRSRSAPAQLGDDVARLLPVLLEQLAPGSTFDAMTFARKASAIGGPRMRIDDARAVEAARTALRGGDRRQGTDLVAALHAASARLRERKARRPVVLVFTDGFFPTGLERRALRRVRARLPAQTEIVFVVDDPLRRGGVSPSEHLAVVAAQLDARLTLTRLGHVDVDGVHAMLSAPKLMRDLDVKLPGDARLIDPVPPGLVAGDFVVLRGHYTRRPPTQASISGRVGATRLARRVRATRRPPKPEAFVATVPAGDLAAAVREGFVLPPWYHRDDFRDALHNIEQARRTREYTPRGYLDRKVIGRYLTTRVLPRARVCYNHALRRNREQQGRAVLEIEVGKGETMMAELAEAQLQVEDNTLRACLVEAGWALDVPAGQLDDGIYRIRYPLQLVPPEDERQWRVMVIEGE